jgi:glycerol-3-phosphate dehydrogenase
MDDLNEAKLRAEVVKMFVDAGGNITTAARLAGLTEEDALALVEVEYGTVTQ